MDRTLKFKKQSNIHKNTTYELWYSEFNCRWMIVKNNLHIIDAKEYYYEAKKIYDNLK